MVYYLRSENHSSGSTASLHTISISPIGFQFQPLLINRSLSLWYRPFFYQHQNACVVCVCTCKSASNPLESSGNQQNALPRPTKTGGSLDWKMGAAATVVLRQSIFLDWAHPIWRYLALFRANLLLLARRWWWWCCCCLGALPSMMNRPPVLGKLTTAREERD